ncbi:ABC transporter ATP-binding protein [Algoriphagus sp.]|uniref:ABC transporter ATP-binding protein n=1 Tax=Algoriphagus sp. TaxID=1872435 RepID=UPI003F72B9A4
MKSVIDKYFRHFAFFYKYLGFRIVILVLLSFAVGLLDGFGLALFLPIFSMAADGDDFSNVESLGDLKFLLEWVQNAGIDLTLGAIVTFMVCLFLLKAVFKFFDGFYKVKLQNIFLRRIRYQMVDGLSELDYKNFLKIDSGKVQNTLSGETIKITYGFLAYFNSVQHVVLLLVYLGLALLSNFQFAILVSIGGYFSNFIFRYLFKNTEKASIGLSKLGHNFHSYLVQAVHNFKYLKATDYFHQYRNRLKFIIDEIEFNQRKIGIYSAIMSSMREPIVLGVVVVIVFFQVNVLGGTLSSVLLSLLYFYRALNYIITLQGSWQGFISNYGGLLASVEMIAELKDGKEENVSKMVLKAIDEINLAGVSFSYSNGRKVLDEINLSIKPLTSHAFVGESGSGKTSLVNLLIGLLQPDEGIINVNGSNRKEVSLSGYRKRFGYITQEPVIFSDSLYNNITLWAERTPENLKRLMHAIQLANLKEFVSELKDGIETSLGDNGMLVSGGQKQRISIARELFKEVDVLIFDEATSALDSETEKSIQNNIDELMGKFTIIIIAHRLSTIRKADRISLMNKGKITMTGSFEELIQNSKQFKRMVELQEF